MYARSEIALMTIIKLTAVSKNWKYDPSLVITQQLRSVCESCGGGIQSVCSELLINFDHRLSTS